MFDKIKYGIFITIESVSEFTEVVTGRITMTLRDFLMRIRDKKQ